jgi:hypothetical protein
MNWVWEFSRTVGNDRLVLLAIADRASDEGMDAWPSIGTLGRKTRLHPRTVQRCIRNIEALGELRIEPPAANGSGPNVYVVLMDTLVLQSTSRPHRRHPPPRQLVRGGKLSPGGGIAGGGVAASPPGGGVDAGGGVALSPPDSSCTSSTSGTSTTATSPRTLATEPNDGGNYAVIAKLAGDLCRQGSWTTQGGQYPIVSASTLVDALKDECGRLGIDRGSHPDVAVDVVHRAAESAWFKHTHPELVQA